MSRIYLRQELRYRDGAFGDRTVADAKNFLSNFFKELQIMNTKLLQSLLFAVIAATSSLTLAQSAPADARDQAASAFPHAPVGSPFIE